MTISGLVNIIICMGFQTHFNSNVFLRRAWWMGQVSGPEHLDHWPTDDSDDTLWCLLMGWIAH